MSTILNWEASKTTGGFESLGGSYRIVPDANGYLLIADQGTTLKGQVWSKKFKRLDKAKAWPRGCFVSVSELVLGLV